MSHNKTEIMKIRSILKTTALIITCIFVSSCNEEQSNTERSLEKPKVESGSDVKNKESIPPVEAETAKEEKPEEFRIENVKKVFVHTPGGYSVLYENRYSKELVNSGHISDIDFIRSRASSWTGARVITKIYNDIDGESGYVVIRFYNSNYFEADIHISVRDITGGDFKYRTSSKGSSKTGTTRVVE